MSMKSFHFSIMVWPEPTQKGGVKYVAQCVEFDICVQGKTIAEIKARFLQAVNGHISIAQKNGVEPFECLPTGPCRMTDLDKEFDFYRENQDALVKKYDGRFLVIKNREVIGDYESLEEAYLQTVDAGHVPGTFLLQYCEAGEESFTETYQSRVTFQ